MKMSKGWKIFIGVFVVALIANILMSYVWSRLFHNSPWQWDTTTATALAVAIAVSFVKTRKKKTKQNTPPPPPANIPKQKISDYAEKLAYEKTARKEKIMRMIEGKNSISNDEVEKALGISDATATNYLDELEKEGLIEQLGSTGRFVSYRKVNFDEDTVSTAKAP